MYSRHARQTIVQKSKTMESNQQKCNFHRGKFSTRKIRLMACHFIETIKSSQALQICIMHSHIPSANVWNFSLKTFIRAEKNKQTNEFVCHAPSTHPYKTPLLRNDLPFTDLILLSIQLFQQLNKT
jgi:hypothetical protein